jgi:hypothetical protein
MSHFLQLLANVVCKTCLIVRDQTFLRVARRSSRARTWLGRQARSRRGKLSLLLAVNNKIMLHTVGGNYRIILYSTQTKQNHYQSITIKNQSKSHTMSSSLTFPSTYKYPTGEIPVDWKTINQPGT